MPRENALIREKSPYLLAHAHNPVNWLPWGEEALAAARAQNKPLFLSIGYHACHWCHVMERECFEDEETAALLNAVTVPVKIDREERPDLDGVYMAACHALTGSGGWPLSVFADADGRPFFAATYIAKHSAFGRTGMLDLLAAIKQAWTTRRPEVDQAAESVCQALLKQQDAPKGTAPDQDVLLRAQAQLAQQFDPEHGGFGKAPKFPSPHVLLFLVRRFRRTGQPELLDMAAKTLTAMRLGGIFDHIGLGFHRYSTDQRWLVPHFEKMLYDQAMLALAYTEAFEAGGDPLFGQAAQDTLAYVLRELTGPQGQFLCAEDADSEGHEGRFYVWTPEEVAAVLPTQDAQYFMDAYSFTPGGNFEDEATRKATGANIPHLRARTTPEEEARLAPLRQALFAAREARVHPAKDDKTLADWNGLTIAALAKAARVFNRPEPAQAAVLAASFLLSHMRDGSGRLLHRYRDGQAAVPGNLDDYAFFTWGLLELHQTTADPAWLAAAEQLSRITLTHFLDTAGGGFFFNADDAPTPILRRKEFYDAALPSGNSVALHNLLTLARLTGQNALKDHAAALAQAAEPLLRQYAPGFAMLLCGIDELLHAGDGAK